MGYQTGTATGPVDLLDKLRVFLLAEGWTVNLYTANGTGYRLHVQKSADSSTEMYFNFRSAVDESGALLTQDNQDSANGKLTGIMINGSTGYNVAEDWDKQTVYPLNLSYNNYACGNSMTQMSISAIPAYYFFAVENTINICVEVTSGKFQFMSFGCLEKQGLYTGGQFYSASFSSRTPYVDWNNNWWQPSYFTKNASGYPHGAVYVDMDGVADWRMVGDSVAYREILWPCVAGQTTSQNYTQSGLASMFWSKAPNFYNSLAATCPIYVLGKRSDANYSLLGWPAGVRFLNCTNYSAGQEVIYGSDTWKIFHADSLNGDSSNLYCGFAFLKEA